MVPRSIQGPGRSQVTQVKPALSTHCHHQVLGEIEVWERWTGEGSLSAELIIRTQKLGLRSLTLNYFHLKAGIHPAKTLELHSSPKTPESSYLSFITYISNPNASQLQKKKGRLRVTQRETSTPSSLWSRKEQVFSLLACAGNRCHGTCADGLC